MKKPGIINCQKLVGLLNIFLLCGLILLSECLQTSAQVKQITTTQQHITAARNVLKRLIGTRANQIKIIGLAVPGNDTYELEAHNGNLTIRGNSASAICYGFHNYLKKACHSMATWNGRHIDIPVRWPDYNKERVTSPYQYRYFLNVVTFGYTTPYWNRKRWEQELDWMALHGINMPLATVASEAIAARVWKKLGLTDREISEFFTGPAHFPWHRMGNLNKWDGPVPAAWHRDQLQLQHHILDRMRELGFQPVAPAFAGFVPEGFQKKHPELNVKRLKWGGFPAEYNAFVLAPNTPYFEQIGKMFIQEWEKEFGKNTYYLSDSFNEMDVPVPNDKDARYKLLTAYGESVYKSIRAGNPDAVWVTQGWTFGYQHSFWDKPSLQALIKNVPDDKMVIIDLANEFPKYVWKIDQTWKTHEGYYGKKWIYSYVPNFGGKTPYVGDLELYASASTEALHSVYNKSLIGFGAAPEGIENNEVIYELLADMGWTSENIDLKKWIPVYCKAKYGACPDKMITAWQQLEQTVYGPSFSAYPRFVWQLVVPDAKRKGGMAPGPLFFKAVENFLDCDEQLKQSELYRYDAIELAAQYLSLKADDYYKQALKADTAGNTMLKKQMGDKAIDLLENIDRLLASHPTDRLQPWINYARSHGTTTAEMNYYESNARRLITTWGGAENDYAARMWSGLIRDYYIPRIKLTLAGKNAERPQWEENWIKQQGITPIQPFDDPVKEAKRMIAAFRN